MDRNTNDRMAGDASTARDSMAKGASNRSVSFHGSGNSSQISSTHRLKLERMRMVEVLEEALKGNYNPGLELYKNKIQMDLNKEGDKHSDNSSRRRVKSDLGFVK